MFRSILVPLDGSPFGEHALPLATSIARRAGARLQVVHAHDPCTARLASYYTLDPAVEQAEQAYLDGVVRRLAGLPGVWVTSAQVYGPAAEVLPGHALASGVDLIVMATHGRGPFSRFWPGSVADRLVRRLPVPILLVRPGELAPALDAEPAARRVLIPLDGSELAEQVLAPALALGDVLGAEYTLLRVVKPSAVLGYDLGGYAAGGTDLPAVAQRLGEARTYLEGVAGRLRARPVAVRVLVAAHAQAATAILAEARAGDTDLIALATHARGGLSRLLLGSVADKVVREAPVPVLVQPPVGMPAPPQATAGGR